MSILLIPAAKSPLIEVPLDVQNAKFTIKADNVPVHAVLMHALMPFQLMPEPTANGLTITKGGDHMKIMESSELSDGFLALMTTPRSRIEPYSMRTA